MNLLETLKNFKDIKPDAAYTEKSKRMILATEPRERWSFGRGLMNIFETGIAVALAVFFILVIAGQFSNAPYVSPARFSVINPETLHAEAQAVDIQIQLASVAYKEATSTTTAVNETTPQTVLASGTTPLASAGFAPTALRASGVASSSVATSTSVGTSTAISVDQALKELSQ
jgi:hypothetical protein